MKFECAHRDADGFCLKYSTYNADYFCDGKAECDRFAEWLGEDTNVPTGGWISVEERLPKPGQMVLVYCRSRMYKKHITVSTYMKDYSHTRGCYWSRRVRDVTHWMPLPEPPEV